MKNYKFRNESARTKEEKDEETNAFDERSTLEAMLKIMQPGETVTRTIKRLGASIAKAYVSPLPLSLSSPSCNRSSLSLSV